MRNLPPSLRFLEANAWAMEPRVFEALAEIVERHAEGVRLDKAQIATAIGREVDDAPPSEPRMRIVGSTAMIALRGVVARYADQVNDVSQPTGRSADSLLADIATAKADPSVRRVVLRIDSPGGTVAGTAEIAEAVRDLSASGKPVHAFVDGLCASAAYWIASQADEIVAASPTSTVGSIGVLTAIVERSPSSGTKVHVIRSAALKAPGAMGSPVDEAQLKAARKYIDDLADAFGQAVAGGRGLTAEKQAAATTGEVFAAARALAMGLIDGVESWGAFSARVAVGGALPTFDEITVHGEPIKVVATLSPAGTPPVGTTAGDEPASIPATPEGTDTMRITAQVLLALFSAFHDQHALISSMATGDPSKGIQPATEDEIRAACITAQHNAASARAAALEAKATADAAAHAAALAAKDARIAELEATAAKSAKVSTLGAGAAVDPGADHTGANVSTDEKLKVQWDALSAEQRMGFCNDFAGFKAWEANKHRDRQFTHKDAAEKAADKAKA